MGQLADHAQHVTYRLYLKDKNSASHWWVYLGKMNDGFYCSSGCDCQKATGLPPARGGTRVGFGWVCAAQASKCGPRFRKDLQPKLYPVLKNRQIVNTPFYC